MLPETRECINYFDTERNLLEHAIDDVQLEKVLSHMNDLKRIRAFGRRFIKNYRNVCVNGKQSLVGTSWTTTPYVDDDDVTRNIENEPTTGKLSEPPTGDRENLYEDFAAQRLRMQSLHQIEKLMSPFGICLSADM